MSGNYDSSSKKKKKINNNIQKQVRQKLQQIMKDDNYDFLRYIHELSNNDPFYYLSNIGNMEIVKTPVMFEAYEREATSSYSNYYAANSGMFDESNLGQLNDNNDNDGATSVSSSSLDSSAIVGISVFSVGVLLLISSLLIFR